MLQQLYHRCRRGFAMRPLAGSLTAFSAAQGVSLAAGLLLHATAARFLTVADYGRLAVTHSRDDVAGVVGRYRQDCGLDVRHLSQTNRGPGAARNLGLAEARAPLLGFTDSDCEPAEDWLEAIVAAFESDVGALIGGCIEFRQAAHLSGRCVNFLMSSSLGGGGARNPRARMSMKYYPRTCNMAVRTAVARRAGGFPHCRYGEDIAFSHAVPESAWRAITGCTS